MQEVFYEKFIAVGPNMEWVRNTLYFNYFECLKFDVAKKYNV